MLKKNNSSNNNLTKKEKSHINVDVKNLKLLTKSTLIGMGSLFTMVGGVHFARNMISSNIGRVGIAAISLAVGTYGLVYSVKSYISKKSNEKDKTDNVNDRN